MPFQLNTITECTLKTLTSGTHKHGKEDVPAMSFRLSFVNFENETMPMFSSTLLDATYMAVPGQEDLPGIEKAKPLLRSRDVTKLSPDYQYNGWTVYLARGLDDDALKMERCKIDDFHFDLHEGGRYDFDCRISTSDLDEAGAGMLWGRQKRKVFVRVVAPELSQVEPIDGSTAAFEADHPAEPDAGDLFAAEHGDQHAGDFGTADRGDDEGSPVTSDELGGEGADSEGGETDIDQNDAAAFEAGLSKQIAAKGLKPKSRAPAANDGKKRRAA